MKPKTKKDIMFCKFFMGLYQSCSCNIKKGYVHGCFPSYGVLFGCCGNYKKIKYLKKK